MTRTRSSTYSTPTWQRVVAILLAVVLTLMAWDANTLTYAFAADQPAADPVTDQADGKDDPIDTVKASADIPSASDTADADNADGNKGADSVDQPAGKAEPAIVAQGENDAPATTPEPAAAPKAAAGGQMLNAAAVKTYTVTWLDDDGSVLAVQEGVESGTTASYPGEVPSKEDVHYVYTFNYWSVQGKPTKATSSNLKVTSDKTFVANYTKTAKKYTVTINFNGLMKPNGETYSSSVSNTLGAGTSWNFTQKKLDNLISAKSFDLGGVKYEYKGVWKYEDGTQFTGTFRVNGNDLTGDTTFNLSPVYEKTAVWHLYANYFDKISTGSGSWSNVDSFVDYTHTFKDPSVKTPKSHYRFLYWQEEESGDVYAAGEAWDSTQVTLAAGETKTVDFYAIWQPSVTVNYHNWDGSLLSSVEEFEGINVNDAYAAPEIEGAEFLGWYDADGALVSSDAVYQKPELAGKEVVDPVVHDVYARYSTSYEVQHAVQSLDDEGAYEVVDQSTVNDVVLGSTVSAAPNTYEGFTFDPSAEGTLTETAITAPGTVLKLFYARNSHTVTYAYEGDVPENATEAPAEATYKYGATVAVEPDVAVEGYTFSGWSVKGTFEMPDEDVVITGSFTKNPAPAAPAGGTVAPDPTDPTEPTEPESPVTPTEPTTPAEPEAPTTAAAAAMAPAATAPAATAPAAAPVVFAPAPAPAAVDEPVVVDEPTATPIADDDTPMAQTIADDETPLDSGAIGSWALINLISTIATVIIGLVLIVRMFGRKRDEDEEREEHGEYAEEDEEVAKRHRLLKGIAFLAAPISIVAFLLTEDMTLPMAMVDQWTILMLVILLAQVILAVASRKTDKDTDDDQTQQAAPMTA